MTKLVKIQLTIFAVVTVISLLIMSVVYLQIPRALGWQRTDVALEMPDTGGLYKNANVSYLGSTIGRVDAVTLKPGRVVAELHFDSGADVPENVRAEIRSVSAVGEQFVEFIPEGEPVGELADGTVLGEDRIDMPQGIGPVLDQATVLMASIDDAKMRRVISESFDAFNGSDRDLQQFLDSAQLLLEEAQNNSGATRPSSPTLQANFSMRCALGDLLRISRATSSAVDSSSAWSATMFTAPMRSMSSAEYSRPRKKISRAFFCPTIFAR